MPNRKLPPITQQQWDEAVFAYEVGSKGCRQIANELGVSPATVSRRLKERGAIKGSRVSVALEQLNADLSARYRDRLAQQERKLDVALDQLTASTSRVGTMVYAVVAALEAGDLRTARKLTALKSW